MKYIQLTQNKQAVVDDEDYEWLNQWKWYYHTSPASKLSGYAARVVRSEHINGKRVKVMMHRLIHNTPDGLETDHINRNKLDNRRINLRSVTKSVNKFNNPIRPDNTSGFVGVSWSRQSRRWRAVITIKQKTTSLGSFHRLIDAVEARTNAEEQLEVYSGWERP